MSYTTDNYEFTVPEIDDIPDISVLSQNWDNLDEILNGIDKRNKIETVSSTVDLNGYTEQGIYRFTSSHIPTNVPSGCTEGWLFVVPWNNAYEAVQFWLNYADRKVYIRKRVYPVWGEWNGLTTSAELSDVYNQLHGLIESNTALILALQAAIGSPLVASSAESMTDQTKIYVYTGTTTSSLTNGHWYYYDNGWIDGGVYNSFALETDKTLSIPDVAADAETVGDEITDLKSTVNIIYKESGPYNWSELATTEYPTGWRVGYYNSTTGLGAISDDYIRTYSYFTTDCVFFHVIAPNGYNVRVYKYQDNGTFAGASDAWKPAQVVFVENGYKYRFALHNFHGAASDYLNTTFLNTIILKMYSLNIDDTLILPKVPAEAKATGDRLNLLEKTMDTRVFNWSDFSIIEPLAPLGWGTGYFDSSDGSIGSSTNYMRTKVLLDSRFFNENDIYCQITPPPGYHVRVIVKDENGTLVENINNERIIDKVVGFYINHDYRYGFTIGVFNGDSGNYLTEEFTSNCVLKIFSKCDNKIYKNNPKIDYIWNSEYEYALKLPSDYNSYGDPTRLVILCHGLTSTVSADSWSANATATKFVNEGYAVIDVNRVTTQDWCNPELIKKYIHAVYDVCNIYNLTPDYIFGFSMGSLIGLCLSTIIKPIKACVISGIRLDFGARYELLSNTQKEIVDSNLGFTNGFDAYVANMWCKTAISVIDDNNNPIITVPFPPTFFIKGSDDTLTAEESVAVVTKIKRGGTICSLQEYTGNHDDVCALRAGTSFNDAISWFSQW